MATDRKTRQRGNGEGSIFKRTDGRWCAQISLGYEGGCRKRKYVYGKTRGDVSRQLTTLLRAVQQGLPVHTEKQTVGTFLSKWLEETVKPSARPRTYYTYEHRIRLHLVPAFGRIALDKLTPQHVQSFIAQQQRVGASPASISGYLAVLGCALNQAVRWQLIPRNVVSLVDAPRVIVAEGKVLTPEEARRFLAAASEHRLESLFWLFVTTGLRRAEALGLRWHDIDLETATLTVRTQLQRLKGKTAFTDPKTAKSRRTLALPPATVAALRRQQARQEEERVQAGAQWQEWDLVFTGPRGGPLSTSTLQRVLDAMLAQVELPRLTVHRLRHCAATFMVAANVNPKLVMDAMGHSTLEMTMQRYQHVTDPMRRAVAEGMENLIVGLN